MGIWLPLAPHAPQGVVAGSRARRERRSRPCSAPVSRSANGVLGKETEEEASSLPANREGEGL